MPVVLDDLLPPERQTLAAVRDSTELPQHGFWLGNLTGLGLVDYQGTLTPAGEALAAELETGS